MTVFAAPAPPRPFFAVTGLCFRIWPIVAAGILMEGLLRLGREPARWLWHHGPAGWADRPWIFVGLAILLQAVVGLGAIAIMRRLLPTADPNLRWPERGKTMIGQATLIGIAMGLIMLVADYWPQMLTRTAQSDYPVNLVDSSGWLVAMAITGIAEETIFRGLLVGALVVLIPGRVRVGSIDLPVAGYVVSLLFGISHWQSFLHNPLHLAIAQQLYAFVWGLTYVWLMERSRSLVAPIIAHGLGDAVEVGLAMAMTAILT